MDEEHLDLLPELHRDFVLAGLGDVTYDLAGIFVFLTSDLSRIGVRAAFGFGRTDLADLLQGPVASSAFAGRSPVRVRVIATELFELIPLGANVLIVLRVPFEVCTRSCAIGSARLVKAWNVRRDLAVDQPS